MSGTEMTLDDALLLQRARDAAQGAYCPYSRFPVGAALHCDLGVITGCNVENASYGLAICAERVALFAAIAQGAKRITRLAVSCIEAAEDGPAAARMPCGACRQVMAELMPPDAIVLIDGVGPMRVADLLPQAFCLETRAFRDFGF
jgi:cytidine deaminase